MIELNKWFFVQLANFLILLVILNVILFRPLLELFKQRKETIEGSLEEARSLDQQKEEQLKLYIQELAEAREKAKEIYNTLRQEGLQEQKALIAKAHEEAMAELEAAKASIRGEVEKVRKAMGEYVRQFSDEIVKKLVEV